MLKTERLYNIPQFQGLTMRPGSAFAVSEKIFTQTIKIKSQKFHLWVSPQHQTCLMTIIIFNFWDPNPVLVKVYCIYGVYLVTDYAVKRDFQFEPMGIRENLTVPEKAFTMDSVWLFLNQFSNGYQI